MMLPREPRASARANQHVENIATHWALEMRFRWSMKQLSVLAVGVMVLFASCSVPGGDEDGGTGTDGNTNQNTGNDNQLLDPSERERLWRQRVELLESLQEVQRRQRPSQMALY